MFHLKTFSRYFFCSEKFGCFREDNILKTSSWTFRILSINQKFGKYLSATNIFFRLNPYTEKMKWYCVCLTCLCGNCRTLTLNSCAKSFVFSLRFLVDDKFSRHDNIYLFFFFFYHKVNQNSNFHTIHTYELRYSCKYSITRR